MRALKAITTFILALSVLSTSFAQTSSVNTPASATTSATTSSTSSSSASTTSATTTTTATTPVATTTTSTDPLTAQKESCSKNTAMEWSSTMNRCVGKAQARQERHDAQNCNKLEDLAARKACHMQLATQKTGVTDNPEEAAGKVSSLQSRSTMINAATSIVSLISMFGSKKAGSSCMSKSIMGVTSLGGLATDIWMKIQTKKKLKSLQDKYQIDSATSPYDAQVRAMHYLKEEQQTVKKIAGQEKKRQMLLMIGYAAAAVAAGYESFTNASCWKKEPEKPVNEGAKEADGAATANADAKPQPNAPAPETPNGAKPAADAPAVADADAGTPKIDAATAATSTTPVNNPSAYTAPSQSDSINGLDQQSDSYKKYESLESRQTGNKFHNVLKDSNGNVTAVVHNGQVYTEVGQSKGTYFAKGSPSGTFDYNTGTVSGPKIASTSVNNVAVTQNYTNASGRIISGSSGSTNVSNTSFGTGGKKGK